MWYLVRRLNCIKRIWATHVYFSEVSFDANRKFQFEVPFFAWSSVTHLDSVEVTDPKIVKHICYKLNNTDNQITVQICEYSDTIDTKWVAQIDVIVNWNTAVETITGIHIKKFQLSNE